METVALVVAGASFLVAWAALRHTRHAAQAADLRPPLILLRDGCGTLVAKGRVSNPEGLTVIQEPTTRLKELEPGIRDRVLRRQVRATVEAAQAVFQWAPGFTPRRNHYGEIQDLDWDRRSDEAIEAARQVTTSTEEALARVSMLQGGPTVAGAWRRLRRDGGG